MCDRASALVDDAYEQNDTLGTATALGAKPVGARVNLEVDIIAKYVERLTAAHRAGAPAGP